MTLENFATWQQIIKNHKIAHKSCLTIELLQRKISLILLNRYKGIHVRLYNTKRRNKMVGK